MNAGKITQEVTLRQQLTVDRKEQKITVVEFSCRVPENGQARPISTDVRDVDLYEENLRAVRTTQQEFQNAVWDTEDRIRDRMETGE